MATRVRACVLALGTILMVALLLPQAGWAESTPTEDRQHGVRERHAAGQASPTPACPGPCATVTAIRSRG